MRTVKEISSGGIVYRRHQGVTVVALIRVRNRWCLPKGQVEEGEAVQETMRKAMALLRDRSLRRPALPVRHSREG